MLGAGAGDCEFKRVNFFTPPLSGGLDLDGRNSGCARLGGEVGPPLGVVVEEVAVLVVLVRRHRHAVRFLLGALWWWWFLVISQLQLQGFGCDLARGINATRFHPSPNPAPEEEEAEQGDAHAPKDQGPVNDVPALDDADGGGRYAQGREHVEHPPLRAFQHLPLRGELA